MKNSKLHKSISIFVLLVYSLTQAIAFDGLVLCQGENGYTAAIEFVNDGCCAGEESTLGHSDSHKNHADSAQYSIANCQSSYCDDCGDCEDVVLVFVSGTEGLQKPIVPPKPSKQRTLPSFLTILNQDVQFSSMSLPPQLFSNNFSAFPPYHYSSNLINFPTPGRINSCDFVTRVRSLIKINGL